MAGNTQNLGLYFKEPLKDGNDTFNIQTMLNDNWNKLDTLLSVLSQSKPLAQYVTDRLQDYIKTSEKGAVSGVATLGTDGKVPSSQLPEMDYIKSSEKGSENGVATLNSTGVVPFSQLSALIPKFEVVYYTGTGTAGSSASNRTRIPFSFEPDVVFISDKSGFATFVIPRSSGMTSTTHGFWPGIVSTTAAENDPIKIPIKYWMYSQSGKYFLALHNDISDSDSRAAKFQFNKADTEYTAVAIGRQNK